MYADYDYDQFPIDKDELYMEGISSNSLMANYFMSVDEHLSFLQSWSDFSPTQRW